MMHTYRRIMVTAGITALCCVLSAVSAGASDIETLTLEESIGIALKNNPAVRIAEEENRKANAMVGEAFAAGMPKVSLDGTYQRVDSVPVANLGENSVPLGSLDNRAMNLVVAQPIDVFGLVKTAKKAAESGRSAYRHGSDRQVNDTTLDTKAAFFGVLRAQAYLKVQEDRIAQLEAHLKDTQAHYDAGSIAKFDVLRAETELANARQGLISAQNGVEIAKAVFNNVLGRPLDTSVNLVEPEMPGFVIIPLEACIESACRTRPEVLQSTMFVDMNDRMTDVARLNSKPKINFRWAYDRNLDVTMFNPRESSWRAFLTVSTSIFDGGATRASVDKAESEAQTSRLALEQITNGVALDTRQSYLSLAESRERINASEKALEQAGESMRLADVRYKGGVSTQIEVLDARTALTMAEINHVNALYDYQVSLAKLERAVGGSEQMAKLMNGSQMAEHTEE